MLITSMPGTLISWHSWNDGYQYMRVWNTFITVTYTSFFSQIQNSGRSRRESEFEYPEVTFCDEKWFITCIFLVMSLWENLHIYLEIWHASIITFYLFSILRIACKRGPDNEYVIHRKHINCKWYVVFVWHMSHHAGSYFILSSHNIMVSSSTPYYDKVLLNFE